MRDNYPFGLMAVPMSEIVRLHASSGTTGKPIVVGYTRKDLSIWAEVVARCLTAYGLTKNDSVQVSYGYGLFTGGLGAHAGVENIGGTVIPMSSGNTQKQIQLMHDGQHGELVFTTLTKEGMPMIRYRTRDLTHLIYDKCECGRTAVRMGRILGRSDDMLIIRGVNVFPSQVESVILEMPEFEPHYLIVVDRVNNTDTFQIQVEVRQEFYSDEMNKMIALKKKIANRMQSVIGLQPDIRIVEPRSIERSMGKAKHVIDNRKLE